MSLSIVIGEYSLAKGHIEYILIITDNVSGERWSFKRRYSQIRHLHQNLKHFSSQVPKFPPKKIFGNKNKEFIETRKRSLEIYLNSLSNNHELGQSAYFKDFIRPQDKTLLKQGTDKANTAKNRQKTVEEAEEALKPALTQIVEETSTQFMDLSTQPNPVGEEDSKAKAKEYLQAATNISCIWKCNVPKNDIPISNISSQKIALHRENIDKIFNEAIDALSMISIECGLIISKVVD
ncbi:unnamed protein product [Blepharisma stoltei]|uniref:PX domain-containing protein n=1 Tax=Blepharisma stoltei TaxID=1481888 RepID=A0AAU9J1N9_9CILI|nr:unnamed protein product [Blepharisma stoltei]